MNRKKIAVAFGLSGVAFAMVAQAMQSATLSGVFLGLSIASMAAGIMSALLAKDDDREDDQ